jgi:putative iron-dependent peroxidase
VNRSRGWVQLLSSSFTASRVVDGFGFNGGRGLSGYIDGTENPVGEDARAAAVCTSSSATLAGSSFVAVQQWVHDLGHFQTFSSDERDNIFGRRISDNKEMEEAPAFAHVKRTAQESFDPEAFLVRRSMPWADAAGEGLMFVAFGHSFDAFEAQLRGMLGLDDGIVDGLFSFSRAMSGSYFWCPPVLPSGRLDLTSVAP